MQIEEIFRSCANEPVARAAVASIGGVFYHELHEAARGFGMGVGEFTVFSVNQFARHGDEGELRLVIAEMAKAQEPLLAGLHRILTIMLAAQSPLPTRSRAPIRMLGLLMHSIPTDARRERSIV